VDSSEESLKKISNIKFDFIYIDGGHSYPVVTSDIKMCIPLLKNQGIICGDDYEIIYDHCDQKKIMEDVLDIKQEFCLENKTQKPYHPGVTLAVKDFFGSIPSHNGFWAQMKINDKFTNIDI